MDIHSHPTVDHWRERAIMAEAEIERLRAALRCFLEDDRFHVAVGGNPNVVDQMLADASKLLTPK
jgi:hypothetical protein